jgi:hypothetical protein
MDRVLETDDSTDPAWAPHPVREDRHVSVLFGPGPGEPASGLAEPACFRDLNLDRIVGDATGLRADHDLADFFRQPLRDPDALGWRHEVFRDIERPEVAAALDAFAEAMRAFRASFQRLAGLHDPRQKQAELVSAAGIYGAAVAALNAALHEIRPAARALRELAAWLRAYTGGPTFRALEDEAAAVRAGLGAVTYSLLISGDRVRVTRYAEQEDYGAVILAAFARFAQVEGRDQEWTFPETVEMNHIEAGILDRVALLFPEPFERLAGFAGRWGAFADPVLLRFDREIQFYLAWRGYTAPLRAAGLALSLPELSDTSKEERAEAAYDMALAGKLLAEEQPVVTNDFHLSGTERIIVVSGPNQGGKTTFARMFGQMHWLAALGLPLPGRNLRLFVPDAIFTHFERQETVATERGKLEDEVFRIHEILDAATPQSLIIINEIFASTSLEDAVMLAGRVMARIVELDCLAVCVTFLDELSRIGPSVVSCMSTVVPDNPAERTFRIERRAADGNACAIALARRRGLTHAQIVERIRP